ncbi:MAG: ion transporter [Streptococcus sp.]|nr:ion transporter [Streptococcus sp.]
MLLTSENWNNNLYDCLNANVNQFLSSIYLISWIWIGNFMLLNLVLSILLDAFSEEDEEEKE